MKHHFQPVSGQRFLTHGVVLLLALMFTGAAFAFYRLLFGLEAVTNLNNTYPWGIWIAVDVATGVALAAGGFTTAALVYIFRCEHYHAIIRSALLTALLGYTFVVLGLMLDLGRYYNIWHPLVPSMWSGHSVLFEVGTCFMAYITVLYIEFVPIVSERFLGKVKLPGILSRLNSFTEVILRISDSVLNRCLFVFIILGVVLSCLHQSSLGTLMVIAPSKMHSLWYTPILPMLFLLSAICVGFPMVIFESIISSCSFKRPAEMDILTPLSRFIPPMLIVYAAFKLGDLAIREQFSLLFTASLQANLFLIELIGGVIFPCVLLFLPAVRKSAALLFTASALIIAGVALNRINVFLTAYQPLNPAETYFPSWGEIAVTLGLISTLILIYRFVVIHFPVLPPDRKPSCA